jgi:hypothetical protein
MHSVHNSHRNDTFLSFRVRRGGREIASSPVIEISPRGVHPPRRARRNDRLSFGSTHKDESLLIKQMTHEVTCGAFVFTPHIGRRYPKAVEGYGGDVIPTILSLPVSYASVRLLLLFIFCRKDGCSSSKWAHKSDFAGRFLAGLRRNWLIFKQMFSSLHAAFVLCFL